MTKFAVCRLFTILFVAAVALVTVGAPSGVAAGAMARCEGERVPPPPVMLVHGFISDPDSGWSEGEGPGPVQQTLEAAGHEVRAFDYGAASTRWVTHPEIGPRLADEILSLSRAYVEQCGDGKIIIVAHSMGGAATRCALTVECGSRENVADAVGLVVTLGTPHLGSHLRDPARDFVLSQAYNHPAIFALCAKYGPGAFVLPFSEQRVTLCEYVEALTASEAGRAFTLGSTELAELPAYPSGVPVRALAGRIQVLLPTLHSARLYDIGDVAVGAESATAASTGHAFGGSRVVACGLVTPATWWRCWHVSLTTTDDFVNDVAATVQSYQDSLNKRAQEAAAAAEAAALAAERAAAEAGVLPAPRGPVFEVTRERESFPYTMQAIAATTSVQLGDQPAPAGRKWVLVAVQIRGLLKDRDMPPPDMLLFNFSWPGGCPSNYYDDPYLCNNEDLRRVTDFMPVDAISYNDPRNITGDGVIPAGQPVDVVYRVLVPDEVDLEEAVIKYGLHADKDSTLPLRDLPEF